MSGEQAAPSAEIGAVQEVLTAHNPNGYFTAKDGHRECYCGDVLAEDETLVSHLAAALVAARADVYREAADRLDREVVTEEARLTSAEHPHPWLVPMLSNWLGGLTTAARVLRDEAERIERSSYPSEAVDRG